MSLPNLKMDAGIQSETDNVGSSGPIESGLYNHTVEMAYFGKSEGGAISVTVHLNNADKKRVRETFWVTSKTGQNWYENKQGEKHYLPGFNLVNSLCLLCAGKELGEMATEEKLVNIYSAAEKKEIPTKVSVLMELLGKEIISGVLRQTVNKQVKGPDGKYVDTADTRQENVIDKFFRARDRMTFAEISAQAKEPVFINTWETKWKGVDRDRTNKNAAAAPAAGGVTAKPTTSLFTAT